MEERVAMRSDAKGLRRNGFGLIGVGKCLQKCCVLERKETRTIFG